MKRWIVITIFFIAAFIFGVLASGSYANAQSTLKYLQLFFKNYFVIPWLCMSLALVSNKADSTGGMVAQCLSGSRTRRIKKI